MKNKNNPENPVDPVNKKIKTESIPIRISTQPFLWGARKR
jgi:hypothetical protein